MKPIFCASYPRSGCRYLAESLKLTLGDVHHWVDKYRTKVNLAVHNHIKSHDFELHEQPPPGWGFVVQIRNPWDAIASWYDLASGRREMPDSNRFFIPWAEGAARYWNGFVMKWCKPENVWHIVRHEMLVKDPVTEVAKVAAIMGMSPDRIVAKPLRKPSSFHTHRYYNRKTADKISAICKQGMGMLGYRAREGR